jgi:Fe-S-cluster-containing hydrogenase component 2
VADVLKRLVLISSDMCVGCRTCENICSFTKERYSNPSISRIKVVKKELEGFDAPTFCRQCNNPPCASACEVKVIHQVQDTGLVFFDEENCNGCKKCISACPFGAIRIHPLKQVAIKCDVCDGDPKCVEWCPSKAIRFMEQNPKKEARI